MDEDKEQRFETLLSWQNKVRQQIDALDDRIDHIINTDVQKLKDEKKDLWTRVRDIQELMKPLCTKHVWYTANTIYRNDVPETYCKICDITDSEWKKQQQVEPQIGWMTVRGGIGY